MKQTEELRKQNGGTEELRNRDLSTGVTGQRNKQRTR